MCALALLLAVAGRVDCAERITNGGFETGNFSGWTTIPAATGSLFDVENYSVHTGMYAVEFGATDSTFDSISQTFSTLAGSSYTLTFYYEVGFTPQPANNEFRVFFDNVLVYDNVNANAGFGTFTFSNLMPTTGTTTLLIQARNAPSFDFLDDVSVTGAVPEPGTETMLSLVGGGFLLWSWSRAKRSS